MANHVQMAALTPKKEMAIESKKMAGIVIPRTKKKRTVAVSWGLVEQPFVPRRVPVDRHQEEPSHRQGGGVDGHRKLVVAVLPEEGRGEGHERHHHQEQESETKAAGSSPGTKFSGMSGTFMSRTKSVMAMAKMPSLKLTMWFLSPSVSLSLGLSIRIPPSEGDHFASGSVVQRGEVVERRSAALTRARGPLRNG